jgi:SAM-dependent methyltransferase
MNQDVISTLIRLNQTFYLTYADSFHKTRLTPWTGWNDLLSYLPTESPAHYVDIGCGNGRWFSFLSSKNVLIDTAIGMDLDTYLLGQARLAFIKDERFRFYQGDCIEQVDDCLSHIGTPSIITSFGLWHHIPSFDLRSQLLDKLLSAVAYGGKVIVSFWQFADDPMYQKKLIYPDAVAHRLSLSSDVFEVGDYFLGWQSSDEVLRFCHSFTPEEVASLAKATQSSIDIIHGSGNDQTNMYVVFSRS